MGQSVAPLLGMAGVALLAAVGFAVYRWLQGQRVSHIEGQVKSYLAARFCRLPEHLRIDCSDDRLWPVLVAFDRPDAGTRHRLQFACWGPQPAFSLLPEQEMRAEGREPWSTKDIGETP